MREGMQTEKLLLRYVSRYCEPAVHWNSRDIRNKKANRLANAYETDKQPIDGLQQT